MPESQYDQVFVGDGVNAVCGHRQGATVFVKNLLFGGGHVGTRSGKWGRRRSEGYVQAASYASSVSPAISLGEE